MVWAVGLGIILSSCSGLSEIDSPDAGRTSSYELGVPNFDMEAVVRLRGDRPNVEVYYSIPRASLVFVQAGEHFQARFEVSVRIAERESETLVGEWSEVDTLTLHTYDETITFDRIGGRTDLEVLPGDYVVTVSVADAANDGVATRRQAVQIPSSQPDGAYLGRPLIEGRGDGGVIEPILALHIPASIDSLRSSVQILNPAGERVEVILQLLKFPSDTSVASPPYWLVPSRGSLAYRGIDWERADTIQVTRRVVSAADESAEIVFSLPDLTQGMYRLSISARTSAGEMRDSHQRMLSVKSATFPALQLLDELVEALAYIAFDDEIDAIRSAATTEEMKRRFDAFWGSLVPNRNLANNLIELYYGRIEEANLFFTGYKDGWKTDMGMIYTIYGPPLYVDRRIDSETWYYSYSDRDPLRTFEFERAAMHRDGPFETYILQRRPYYQREWSRIIDQWRRGRIL